MFPQIHSIDVLIFGQRGKNFDCIGLTGLSKRIRVQSIDRVLDSLIMQLSKHVKWRKLKKLFQGRFFLQNCNEFKMSSSKNCHYQIEMEFMLDLQSYSDLWRYRVNNCRTSQPFKDYNVSLWRFVCRCLWGMTVLQSARCLRLVFERRFVHVFSQPGEIVPFREHFRQLVKDLSVATIQMWPRFGETP